MSLLKHVATRTGPQLWMVFVAVFVVIFHGHSFDDVMSPVVFWTELPALIAIGLLVATHPRIAWTVALAWTIIVMVTDGVPLSWYITLGVGVGLLWPSIEWRQRSGRVRSF